MIFHVLTALLVVLKLLGLITISWWCVVAPSLIVITLALLVLAGAAWFMHKL